MDQQDQQDVQGQQAASQEQAAPPMPPQMEQQLRQALTEHLSGNPQAMANLTRHAGYGDPAVPHAMGALPVGPVVQVLVQQFGPIVWQIAWQYVTQLAAGQGINLPPAPAPPNFDEPPAQ